MRLRRLQASVRLRFAYQGVPLRMRERLDRKIDIEIWCAPAYRSVSTAAAHRVWRLESLRDRRDASCRVRGNQAVPENVLDELGV
jgi:hypothetical protein